MGQGEQVTVLVHGTFANPAYDDPEERLAEPPWWRLTGGDETAADRLQAALEQRDPARAGSVWAPGQDPRDGDLDYRDFVEWSGANRHAVRQRAAQRLSAGLGVLATRRGCTPEDPLEVDYVGHSHGGNIILASLDGVPDNVRPRQVCLLGTPLTWRHIELRFLYLLFLVLIVLPALLGIWSGTFVEDADSGPLWARLIAGVIVLSSMLWLTFAVTRLIRRLTNRRFIGRPAYGPPPGELLARLGGRPAVLFISDEDEADLMMHLGAAPLDAYQALFGVVRPVRAWLRGLRRVLLLPVQAVEILVVRPIAYVIVVPLLEVLLERFGLGFPLWAVLTRNHDMVTWTVRDPYGSAIAKAPIRADDLHQVVKPRPTIPAAAPAAIEHARNRSERELELQRITKLRETLRETATGLVKQVHLSHSGYYKTDMVIDQVADVLAAPDDRLPGIVTRLAQADR